MKKLLAASFVAISFVLYSIHGRRGEASLVVAPPATPSPSVSPIPAASSTAPDVTSTPVPTPTPAGQYRNGQYTGATENAYYGFVQVRATVSGGRLTDVTFLKYPNDNPTSQSINSQAIPYLKQEALSAQNANVDVISGATYTSQAFNESLGSALSSAKS